MRQLRPLRSLQPLLLLVAALLCCAPAAAQIQLRDVRGQEVVLPGPASRVVSLAPHITELLYAAGAGSTLVGTVAHSDYPEAAREVPRIGAYDRVSYESVLTLKPDLVLAWRSGNSDIAVQRLEALGLTVFVQEPRTLEDIPASLREIGILTGNEAAAERGAAGFLAKLEHLRATYGERRVLDVFYQIWNDPLLTLNGEHLISDVVRLCGGRNVFADALPLVVRVSVESVLRADPDVIIASGMDGARPEWLDSWQRWPSLTAVRNKQLYAIHPDLLHRHSLRIIQGAGLLCRQLQRARDYQAGSDAE